MKLRQIVVLGIISFTLLLVLSILFYKERTVFTDIAFHIFYIAKEGNLAIQNNRFGAIFTQLFPLIGIKLNAPLDNVMIAYSLAFAIYYFLIFTLISGLFKNKNLSLVMLLWPVLFVSHTFYWIQSELPQGIAFMLLFFAFYEFAQTKIISSWKWKFYIIAALFIVSGFHPILFIPFTFITLFKAVSSNSLKSKESKFLILLSVLLFVFTIIKSLLINTSGYETSALGGLNNFIKLFPNYFTLDSNKNFIVNCFKVYYFIPILLAIVIYYYFKKREKLKLRLTLLFFFGYLFLINISYYHNTPAHYIENLYLPLSIILLFPFVYDVLPTFSIRKQSLIVIGILIFGIIRIYSSHSLYSIRLAWETNFLEVNRSKKLFIDTKILPMDTLIDTWGVPYEFWLLSTSKYGVSSSVMFSDSIEQCYYILPQNKAFFLTPFSAFYYDEFNSPYFNFTDTSRYVVRKRD